MNAETGGPVLSARVMVTGTQLVATTNVDGTFRLTDVPVNAMEVIARAIGYKPTSVAFSLAPSGTTTVAISMSATSVELDAVMVTGVGDTRPRAVGNSIAVVSAPELVGRSTVPNLSELLQAKVPGLTVMPSSGTLGTGGAYRLRGAGSLGASNSPTIYIDGMRVSSRSQGGYDVFGQTTTALDAISPSDIESIEIVKGPAAATLYGAEAAAGVIQILTKKGRPGRSRWQARVEAGASDWDSELRPTNFAIATSGRLADTTNWPGFIGKSPGDIISFHPMTDGRALRTGALSKFILSASGGADRYDFFISAGRSTEAGVYFNNFSNLSSLRGNFAFVPTSTLTMTTSVALSRNHVRLPLNDNAGGMGLIASSYLAIPGRRYLFPGGVNYSTITPELSNVYDNQTHADRYTMGASADFLPVSWFKNSVHAGFDANVGRAELFFAPETRTPAPFIARASLAFDNSKGFIAQARPLNQDVTVEYQGTVTRQLSTRVASNSSFGVQYLANLFRRTEAIGVDLGSANLRSVASAAVKSSSESSSEQKSLGIYAQQQLAFRDRLFATIATRMDNNSAFGAKLNRVFYPKASISYVISEEPFFKVPGISMLRLRGAWGQAGNMPGPFDAARSYTSSVVTYSTGTTSALQYSSAGNPDLRPERGSEIEVGFETALLGGRVELDVSKYSKTTRNALIPTPVPPSTGFTGDQLTNLGTISNTGIEMLAKATLVQRASITIDGTVSLSANNNKLVSFGSERGPVIFGNFAPSQRHQVGLPLGAFWAQRSRYNSDGTLLRVDGVPVLDTAEIYRGPSMPTREIALSSGIRLFGKLHVFGLADYKAGHFQFDVTDWRRDRDGVSWETVNPNAKPDDVLVRKSTFDTYLHIQRADFLKLRDLSISYDVPTGARRNAAGRATLTLAGHNLKIWTRYRGADPELNTSGPLNFNREDLWTAPQTRRYSAALSLTF